MIDALMLWIDENPTAAQALSIGILVVVFAVLACIWALSDKPIDPWDDPDDLGI